MCIRDRAYVDQGLQLACDDRNRIEELTRQLDGHLQDVVDSPALVMHFKRFAVITLSLIHI